MAKEIPDDVRPLESFDIVDTFCRTTPLEWQMKFHKAGEDQFDMTVDQTCDYFERLETIKAQEVGANKNRCNKRANKIGPPL